MSLVQANVGIGNLTLSSLNEWVIAGISIPSPSSRMRVRGHILYAAPITASTLTIIVRRGLALNGSINPTGAQIYNSNALTVPASAQISVPYEIEDDSNFAQNIIPPSLGAWIVTVTPSVINGLISGGNMSAESLP